MTQAAPEALTARRRGREKLRDAIANSDEQPGRGDNSTVRPERLTATAQTLQAAATTPAPAADAHFRAGLNPPGQARPAENTGARPDGTTSPAGKDRGTGRDGR